MRYSFIRNVKDRIPSLFFLASAVRDFFRYTFNIIPKSPYALMIEINNSCNLRCSMCWTKNAQRKKGFMSMDLYRKIINQAAEYGVKHVSLHTVGEPLLHKDLIEMIKFAKSKGLFVLVSTNGQLLDENISRKIIDSGLDILRLSIEGCSREMYEKIRVGGSFERIVGNVRRFRSMRDKAGKKSPIMEINTILIKEDFDYAAKFCRFWKPHVDQIKFSLAGNQAGYSPHIIHSTLRKYFTRTYPCHLLWGTMAITWDGDVSACCIDFESSLKMGSLKKNTIKEIWNNALYKRYRKLQSQGKFDAMPLCGACDARMISLYKLYCLNRKIQDMVR